MEPARHQLIAPDDPALLERLAAALAAQQSEPRINMRRATLLDFECATGPFMLRARVAGLLMDVCGHDQWQRLFRPVE